MAGSALIFDVHMDVLIIAVQTGCPSESINRTVFN